MSLIEYEKQVLRAVESCENVSPGKYWKCAEILRRALDFGEVNGSEVDFALCNTGYEHPEVGQYYDAIRALVVRGLLEGRGNFDLPAGPRYTECRLVGKVQ